MLPADKRETASAKNLLEALETCEQELRSILNSPVFPAYKAVNDKIISWGKKFAEVEIDFEDENQGTVLSKSHKFFMELLTSRQELLNYMTPSEKEQVKQLESGDKDSTHWVNPRGKKS